MCATPVGVYDGGGLHVPESPPEDDTDSETAKKYYVVQPIRDTPVSVYDGGGQHVSTQPDGDSETPTKYYVIHVDKLKLCAAATQSQDSVATLPTTH